MAVGTAVCMGAVDADAADEIPRAHAEVPEAIPSELLLGSRADDGSRVSSLFQALDLNGDGSLSLAELTVYFEHNGALEVLGEMDPDKTGKVSRAAWDAFFAALDPLMMPVYMMSLEEVVTNVSRLSSKMMGTKELDVDAPLMESGLDSLTSLTKLNLREIG